MSALPRIAKAPTGQGAPARSQREGVPAEPAALAIPPPIPTAKATLEQMRASLERGIAQARAGLTEDLDVVQARMRAKFRKRESAPFQFIEARDDGASATPAHAEGADSHAASNRRSSNG